MRVTQNSLVTNLLYDLRKAALRLEQGEQQLSTLKKINRPSDDPGNLVAALRLKNSVSDMERFISNIGAAETWLSTTETYLQSLTSLTASAIDSATRAAAGTLPAGAMDAIAQDIDQLIREAVAIANQSFQGRSLFGGFDTNSRPAVMTEAPNGLVSGVALGTDNGGMVRQIGPESLMEVNYTAERVFGGAGQTIFSDLIELRDAVLSRDLDAIKKVGARLDQHHSRVVGLTTETGAKMNRLNAAKERLMATKFDTVALVSQIEDTDVAAATMYLAAAETAYKTVLAVGARIIMPSLMDFLR